jgi:hypothetical protein
MRILATRWRATDDLLNGLVMDGDEPGMVGDEPLTEKPDPYIILQLHVYLHRPLSLTFLTNLKSCLPLRSPKASEASKKTFNLPFSILQWNCD